MSPDERAQRLRFLDLSEHDAAVLRDLRPLFEQHVPAIEEAFYEHLLASPETASLLQERTTVDRLKKLQTDYLLRITAGTFDGDYFEDRLRIGRTHERVGLSPRWYLSAFSLYFKLFVPLIFTQYTADPDRAQQAVLALEKVFMLDASLAMQAYISSDRYRHLQQLESIVSDSADVIFMLDTEKRIRAWNRAAEKIFGWSASEIVGQPLAMIIPPDRLAAGELERIDRELAAAGVYHFETERLARDGRRVPVEVALSALRDLQGQPLGRSVILRDITEQKRLVEAKIQSERLATIGAMSAKLAHEIRNPLSSITLNIDLLGDEIESLSEAGDASGGEARSLLRSINSEARRIQRVVEDYLKFARLPKLQRTPVSLNELLEHGLAIMDSSFAASQILVRREFDPALPALEVDEGQFWQAVLNLVRNSIEAMPDGGELVIATGHEAQQVYLRITDTGVGMTSEQRAELFRPFFSTKPGGTGLGLPLTQQIIGEHGGRIECETAPGQGATFVIWLPVPKDQRNGKTG